MKLEIKFLEELSRGIGNWEYVEINWELYRGDYLVYVSVKPEAVPIAMLAGITELRRGQTILYPKNDYFELSIREFLNLIETLKTTAEMLNDEIKDFIYRVRRMV